jgi:glutamyl-tRNA reductase
MGHSVSLFAIDRKALPLAERAQFTERAAAVTRALYAEQRGTGLDVVVLSTCERFEVYSVTGDATVSSTLLTLGLSTHAAVALEDYAALRHLFRVASGLESRLPGEPHVLGQVRSALNDAVYNGVATGVLRDVFSYAIRCGKRIRQRTALGASASSYVEQVVSLLSGVLDGLERRHIAIVGTGALALESALAFKAAHIGQLTVIGRHNRRTGVLAREVGADAVCLAALASNVQSFDAVVTAVSAPTPVVNSATFEHFRSRVFADLGAAPNVDPDIDQYPGVRVFRLEDFGGRKLALEAFTHAEQVVEHELDRYLARQARFPRVGDATARQRAS